MSTPKAKTANPANSTFEKVFYRYLAWFPILMLPALVWEMFSSGQTIPALLIATMHAVLVFRFVQVVAPQSWLAQIKAARQ